MGILDGYCNGYGYGYGYGNGNGGVGLMGLMVVMGSGLRWIQEGAWKRKGNEVEIGLGLLVEL